MADEYSYATSVSPQETEFLFSEKQMVYIPDSNGNSYPNSQILFDLASISNSGKFVDWKNAVLTVPLVLNLSATGGSFSTANNENAFAASLKSSTLQLIHSIGCEITNNSVINLTPFSNIPISYTLLNSISSEEMTNLAPTLLFGKDSAESFTYNGTANAGGLGECNNAIKETAFSCSGGWGATYGQNKGRAERMKYTSFDPASSTAAKYTSTTNLNAMSKNYVAYTTSNITYYILATIPLRFLHDLFSKLQLSKGIYMRLVINLNAQSQIVLSTDGSSYTGIISVNSPNNVLPFMLSPMGTSNGFVATGATQITASLGIGKSVVPTTFSHPTQTSCRIYAPVITMSPSAEERYLSLVPTKTIRYQDILSFQILNVNPNTNFSNILSNGVSRARGILLCPMLSATMNGSATIANQSAFTAGFNLGSPMNSPFTTCPGTMCPYSSITNLNFLISGSALWNQNQNYKWENFLNEVRPSYGINGGLSLGMSSGLISEADFENGYGYIWADLSRKVSSASDDIARSIQVTGFNNSAVQIDIYAFIFYEREITLSTSTGSLVI